LENQRRLTDTGCNSNPRFRRRENNVSPAKNDNSAATVDTPLICGLSREKGKG
jgi:hypothetical protein